MTDFLREILKVLLVQGLVLGVGRPAEQIEFFDCLSVELIRLHVPVARGEGAPARTRPRLHTLVSFAKGGESLLHRYDLVWIRGVVVIGGFVLREQQLRNGGCIFDSFLVKIDIKLIIVDRDERSVLVRCAVKAGDEVAPAPREAVVRGCAIVVQLALVAILDVRLRL